MINSSYSMRASDGQPAKPMRKITLKEIFSTLRSAAWHFHKADKPEIEKTYQDAIKRIQNKDMKMPEIRALFVQYYDALVEDGRRIAASNLALRMRRL